MKRIFSLFTAAAMVLSLAACGKQETVETQPAKIETKTTYTGTVSAVSADSLTVSTEDGDVTVTLTDTTTFQRKMGGMGEMSGEMGQMPEGGAPGEMGDVPDGEMPMDKPEGNGGQGEPMDKPDGEMGQQGDPMDIPDEEMGNQPDGMPPEMPNGQQPGEGDVPEKPDGMNDMGMTMPEITIADISVGDTITVETDGNGNALSVSLSGGEMGMGGPGGMKSGVDSYDAVTEFTADATEDSADYASTGKDENAVHVSSGADVTLRNATITRDSADSTGGDNASFYGVGAAALVTDGTLVIDGSTITTDAAGGAGVFAYGGGTAYVSLEKKEHLFREFQRVLLAADVEYRAVLYALYGYAALADARCQDQPPTVFRLGALKNMQHIGDLQYQIGLQEEYDPMVLATYACRMKLELGSEEDSLRRDLLDTVLTGEKALEQWDTFQSYANPTKKKELEKQVRRANVSEKLKFWKRIKATIRK